jgi:hypothetical protein
MRNLSRMRKEKAYPNVSAEREAAVVCMHDEREIGGLDRQRLEHLGQRHGARHGVQHARNERRAGRAEQTGRMSKRLHGHVTVAGEDTCVRAGGDVRPDN